MNFWERVDMLLDQQGINKKTLAADVGFSSSNITKGIKDDNIPSAETAVKIAKRLGVTAEYLITGNEKVKKSYLSVGDLEVKYHAVLTDLDTLSSEKKKLIFDLIKEFKEPN